jgi:calcium/calmodulin-dependent protein kinase I
MLKINDENFFFNYTNYPLQNIKDKRKTFTKYWNCKEIIINGKRVNSSKIYLEKNVVYLEKDNFAIDLENVYLERLIEKKCNLIQKDFSVSFDFESYYFLEEFYQKAKKWLIQNFFEKKYRIENTIDRGSNGEALKIIKISTQECLCVKKIRKIEIKTEKCLRYLKYEIKALRCLRQENILDLKEVFEDSENVYIITEYLDGGNLRHKLKNEKINKEESLFITKSLLKAALEIHRINFLHRDIKPENVVLKNESGNKRVWKLIDFGLCTDKFDKDLMKDKSGTVRYLAPELIKGDFYDEKVDVFSIGIILVEMLDENPFKGKTYQQLLLCNLKCNIFFKNIPQDILPFVKKITSKNPLTRFTSFEALSQDLFYLFSDNKPLLSAPNTKLTFLQM